MAIRKKPKYRRGHADLLLGDASHRLPTAAFAAKAVENRRGGVSPCRFVSADVMSFPYLLQILPEPPSAHIGKTLSLAMPNS